MFQGKSSNLFCTRAVHTPFFISNIPSVSDTPIQKIDCAHLSLHESPSTCDTKKSWKRIISRKNIFCLKMACILKIYTTFFGKKQDWEL